MPETFISDEDADKLFAAAPTPEAKRGEPVVGAVKDILLATLKSLPLGRAADLLAGPARALETGMGWGEALLSTEEGKKAVRALRASPGAAAISKASQAPAAVLERPLAPVGEEEERGAKAAQLARVVADLMAAGAGGASTLPRAVLRGGLTVGGTIAGEEAGRRAGGAVMGTPGAVVGSALGGMAGMAAAGGAPSLAEAVPGRIGRIIRAFRAAPEAAALGPRELLVRDLQAAGVAPAAAEAAADAQLGKAVASPAPKPRAATAPPKPSMSTSPTIPPGLRGVVETAFKSGGEENALTAAKNMGLSDAQGKAIIAELASGAPTAAPAAAPAVAPTGPGPSITEVLQQTRGAPFKPEPWMSKAEVKAGVRASTSEAMRQAQKDAITELQKAGVRVLPAQQKAELAESIVAELEGGAKVPKMPPAPLGPDAGPAAVSNHIRARMMNAGWDSQRESLSNVAAMPKTQQPTSAITPRGKLKPSETSATAGRQGQAEQTLIDGGAEAREKAAAEVKALPGPAPSEALVKANAARRASAPPAQDLMATLRQSIEATKAKKAGTGLKGSAAAEAAPAAKARGPAEELMGQLQAGMLSREAQVTAERLRMLTKQPGGQKAIQEQILALPKALQAPVRKLLLSGTKMP